MGGAHISQARTAQSTPLEMHINHLGGEALLVDGMTSTSIRNSKCFSGRRHSLVHKKRKMHPQPPRRRVSEHEIPRKGLINWLVFFLVINVVLLPKTIYWQGAAFAWHVGKLHGRPYECKMR